MLPEQVAARGGGSECSQRHYAFLYYRDSLLLLRGRPFRGRSRVRKEGRVDDCALSQDLVRNANRPFKFGTDFASTADASSRSAHMHVEKNLHLQGDALSFGQCNLNSQGRRHLWVVGPLEPAFQQSPEALGFEVVCKRDD